MDEKKPEQQRKNYYEELREKTEDIRSACVELPPNGVNGFYAKERKFGYVVCVLFVGLLILFYAISWGNYLNRDKKLTTENYREYFTVKVSTTESANWESFEVSIHPKKDMYTISNFSVTVKITVKKITSGVLNERETTIVSEKFTKNDVLKKTVSLDEIGWINVRTQVLAVSGGM